MVSLQSVPGGPELLVIALIVLLVVGVVVFLGRLVSALADGPESEELQKRVVLLEHEVDDLRGRVEELARRLDGED